MRREETYEVLFKVGWIMWVLLYRAIEYGVLRVMDWVIFPVWVWVLRPLGLFVWKWGIRWWLMGIVYMVERIGNRVLDGMGVGRVEEIDKKRKIAANKVEKPIEVLLEERRREFEDMVMFGHNGAGVSQEELLEMRRGHLEFMKRNKRR